MAVEAELPQLIEARDEVLSSRRRRLRRFVFITITLFVIVTLVAAMAFFKEQQAFVAREQARAEARALYLASPVVAVGPNVSISERGWLVDRGRPLVQIAEGPVNVAVFSADGSVFAAAGQQGVVIGRATASEQDPDIISRLAVPAPVTSLKFSPDRSRIAATSANGTASLWDVRTGEEIAKLETARSGATAATFSPDASLCVVGKRDGGIVVWSTADSRVIATFRMQAPIKSIAFSADQQSLLVGFDSGGYAVIAVSDGKQIESFPG